MQRGRLRGRFGGPVVYLENVMGKRGPTKQNTGQTLLLRLPAELDAEARVAAEREGVALAEWWRRAGAERVLRQTHREHSK